MLKMCASFFKAKTIRTFYVYIDYKLSGYPSVTEL